MGEDKVNISRQVMRRGLFQHAFKKLTGEFTLTRRERRLLARGAAYNEYTQMREAADASSDS